MPIDESWTVRPAPGAKRLSGAEIIEAARRLDRYHPDAAALADVKVVTGWGGGVKRLEVTVHELEEAADYTQARVTDVAPDTLMLGPGQGPAPWFPSDQ